MRKLNTDLNLRDLHSLITDYTDKKCKPWKIEITSEIIRFLTNLNLHSDFTRYRNYCCFLPICIPQNQKCVGV